MLTDPIADMLTRIRNANKALQAKAVRNIEGYNKEVAPEEKLPYWVVVVDELADLMMVSAGEVQNSLVRLAQIAAVAAQCQLHENAVIHPRAEHQRQRHQVHQVAQHVDRAHQTHAEGQRQRQVALGPADLAGDVDRRVPAEIAE